MDSIDYTISKIDWDQWGERMGKDDETYTLQEMYDALQAKFQDILDKNSMLKSENEVLRQIGWAADKLASGVELFLHDYPQTPRREILDIPLEDYYRSQR